MLRVQARPPGLEGFPFYVHDANDVFISEKIRRKGVWEAFETRLMLSLLRPGDHVLDIGANIGWYTVAAARRVGPQGRVFAFEPDRRNFTILGANVRENRIECARLLRAALGRSAGKARIQPASVNQGDIRVRAFSQEAAGSDSREVPVVALDDFLAEEPEFSLTKLRVLKMDVQGFEWEVLAGARRLFESLPTRTVCFVEFDPALLNECSPDACKSFIAALGELERVVFAIGRPVWRLRRMSPDRLRAAAALTPPASFDLIVAHPSAVPELRRALPLVSRLISA